MHPTWSILKVPDKIMEKMHTALVTYCYSSVVSQTQWTWTTISYCDDSLGHRAPVSQLVSCVLISSVCFPSSLDQQGGQSLHFSGSRAWAENMKDFLMPDLELAHNCFYPLPLAEAGPTSQAKVKSHRPEVLAQRSWLLGPVSQSTTKAKLLAIAISQEKILHDYSMHLFIKYWWW